jgi:hypothetical protein
MTEMEERVVRAAVLWYWTCAHGAPAAGTPEHRDLQEAIESLVDADMDGGRVWTRAGRVPDDLHRVEVEGHGTWERVGPTDLFRHVEGVYKLRTFHRLRELGTVREAS